MREEHNSVAGIVLLLYVKGGMVGKFFRSINWAVHLYNYLFILFIEITPSVIVIKLALKPTIQIIYSLSSFASKEVFNRSETR